jgi:hypothetical protein
VESRIFFGPAAAARPAFFLTGCLDGSKGIDKAADFFTKEAGPDRGRLFPKGGEGGPE